MFPESRQLVFLMAGARVVGAREQGLFDIPGLGDLRRNRDPLHGMHGSLKQSRKLEEKRTDRSKRVVAEPFDRDHNRSGGHDRRDLLGQAEHAVVVGDQPVVADLLQRQEQLARSFRPLTRECPFPGRRQHLLAATRTRPRPCGPTPPTTRRTRLPHSRAADPSQPQRAQPRRRPRPRSPAPRAPGEDCTTGPKKIDTDQRGPVFGRSQGVSFQPLLTTVRRDAPRALFQCCDCSEQVDPTAGTAGARAGEIGPVRVAGNRMQSVLGSSRRRG